MVYGTWYLNVTDSRKDELVAFVKSIILEDEIMLLSLNGDASFRRYFRVYGKNLIAVDAPPKTQKNKEFIAIDAALLSVGIRAPKIIASDLDNGFMLIEDLGETTFASVAVGKLQESYYLKAVGLLPKLASLNRHLDLPKFDEAFIKFELSIFDEWMLEKRLGVILTKDERESLNEAYEYITSNLVKQPYVAMHRDFHSRNLMVCENDDLAVIDFQDMVYGPICYDLASIVYDCYVDLDFDLKVKLCEITFEKYRHEGYIEEVNFESFRKQVLLTSLQRHIKVLGIFCRLSLRDGKHGYLKDLSRVIKYVLHECDSDIHFSKLKEIIEKYVVGNF